MVENPAQTEIATRVLSFVKQRRSDPERKEKLAFKYFQGRDPCYCAITIVAVPKRSHPPTPTTDCDSIVTILSISGFLACADHHHHIFNTEAQGNISFEIPRDMEEHQHVHYPINKNSLRLSSPEKPYSKGPKRQKAGLIPILGWLWLTGDSKYFIPEHECS